MARSIFNNPKPQTLALNARTPADLELVSEFRNHCKEQGVSVRQALIQLIRKVLSK